VARWDNRPTVDIRWLSSGVVREADAGELTALKARTDGILWVDVDAWDSDVERTLAECFGLHQLALRDLRQRSHVAKVHAYPEHLLIVLPIPTPSVDGHVSLLELDQVLGHNFLLTVHNEPPSAAYGDGTRRETDHTLERVRGGAFRPSSAADLSHAIVAALARRQEGMVAEIASRIAGVEELLRARGKADPEGVLDEMFQIRHELLTVRTAAAQCREIYGRILTRGRIPPDARPLFEDLADQFDRVNHLGDAEREILQGVIDFFQSRTTTKMNIAMERLALIAAVVLPVTAIASIYGMNVIVNPQTDLVQLTAAITAMASLVGFVLWWAKKHDWW
jgi:magnesium transporter